MWGDSPGVTVCNCGRNIINIIPTQYSHLVKTDGSWNISSQARRGETWGFTILETVVLDCDTKTECEDYISNKEGRDMIRPGGNTPTDLYFTSRAIFIFMHPTPATEPQSSNAVMSFIVCKLSVSSSSSSRCPPRLSPAPHSVSLLWLICFLSGRI